MRIVQSNTLSRQPNFIPKEDMENEDMVMLPGVLFVNLIDTELQEWFLNCEKLNLDAMEALKVLLEEGSTTIQSQLSDWSTKHNEGK